MRSAVPKLTRYIVTPEVHNLRIFAWAPRVVLPDCKIMVIARDDDVTFGILSSRFHIEWAKYNGGVRGEGRTYTPSTTFETFPFPTGLTPNLDSSAFEGHPCAARIATAARKLERLRQSWLNPVDQVTVEPEVIPGYPDRVLPKDEAAKEVLARRTMLRLYAENPEWLIRAHAELDGAVAAAYGWPEDIAIEAALASLLELNVQRAGITAIKDEGVEGGEPL
jgi:type II restriction/modification system DNA methylase subunit YeeA